jgi:23S rRNA pseudouridine1911/1915/1917 synthase
MKNPFPILYEDNHLLVVSKPAGLLSQEDFSGRPDILTVAKKFY